MDETIKNTMRRIGTRGSMCTKTCTRLKYGYSLEDHLREYDEHTRETIEDVTDQLASMSPTDLQSMVDRMDCEQHLQLKKLFNSWTCDIDDSEDDDGYGF